MPANQTTEALISSSEAAQILGVHAASIKRWSDQGKIQCLRTPGGHRRFLRSEINDMRRATVDKPQEFRTRLLDHLLKGAQLQAEGELLSYWGQSGRWEHVGDAVGILLEDIGKAWLDGKLLISEEHVASETLLRSLARLRTMMPQQPQARTCALATAPGDDHTIGLALSELVLAEHNWQTLWLGRHCPTETLIEVIKRPNVGMIAISASAYLQTPQALAQVIREIGPIALATNTQVVLGGSGAWPQSVFGVARVHSYAEFGLHLRDLSHAGAAK